MYTIFAELFTEQHWCRCKRCITTDCFRLSVWTLSVPALTLYDAYLQSRDALCWATEKEVSPPCSSPSRGAGEMLEHSRYPQWTSLKHRGVTTDHLERITQNGTAFVHGEDWLTACYTGSTCPCLSHSCLFLSPQCSASRSRTCQPPLPLRETQHDTIDINIYSAWSVYIWVYHIGILDLLSPQMYLHCLSLVLHLPLKQRPWGEK